jgi:hypothetical protein
MLWVEEWVNVRPEKIRKRESMKKFCIGRRKSPFFFFLS